MGEHVRAATVRAVKPQPFCVSNHFTVPAALASHLPADEASYDMRQTEAVTLAPPPQQNAHDEDVGEGNFLVKAVDPEATRQPAVVGFSDSAAWRYSALMRWASSSWSSRMMMRQAASMGVPWSTSSRARAAMRSW